MNKICRFDDASIRWTLAFIEEREAVGDKCSDLNERATSVGG
jgi:hypothetical protein